jgi:hypothetical protein
MYVNGGHVIIAMNILKSSLIDFPWQRNSRKTNKRREELGLLYIHQQSWNPKQVITLKHHKNLRTYINPKSMIDMPGTGHHVWGHAFRHDIGSKPYLDLLPTYV